MSKQDVKAVSQRDRCHDGRVSSLRNAYPWQMTRRSNFAQAVDEIFRARAATDAFSGVVRITRREHELFAGAHVTAADLDRFLRTVRAGGLLSPELTERFFTPQVHYKDRGGWEMRYGLGMWFYVESDGHVLCCQKEGYNAGVSAVMRYFLDWDVNVVILSNMADGIWEPSWQVHDLVVGEAWGDASDG